MQPIRGFALITTLLLAGVMLMLVLALLQSSVLSMRIADSGQQALQLRQQAWLAHQQQMAANSGLALTEQAYCPAQYAAWQTETIRCQRYLVLSTEQQDVWQSSQVGSIVVQLELPEEVADVEY